MKKWVNKSGGPTEEKAELAPPPILASTETINTPKGKADNSPTPSIPKNTSDGGAQPKKRGARSRYVDILNPNANAAPQGPVAAFIPTFPASNSNVSPPKMMMVSYCQTLFNFY